MHYQGYQSNNKQPAGPLKLLSESYFLKFFHTVRGDPPPTPSSPRALCAPSCSLHSHYAPPPSPTFNVAPKPIQVLRYPIFNKPQNIIKEHSDRSIRTFVPGPSVLLFTCAEMFIFQ